MSWRKGHSHLTLVSNHATGRFVWGKEGKDTATLDFFFDEVGEECSEAITAISMDMGPAFDRSVGKEVHATKAVICYDPFRVVQLVTTAFDKVRRGAWQDLRQLPDQETARRFKDARWAMLKNPTDLKKGDASEGGDTNTATPPSAAQEDGAERPHESSISTSSPNPGVRQIHAPEATPVDLLNAAGGPVSKYFLRPVMAIGAIVMMVVMRRRRSRD